MSEKMIPRRIYIAFAFFGGIIVVLALQSGMSQLRGQAGDIGDLCKADRECAGTNVICLEQVCTPLQNAVCTCSQPQVLQCADSKERARHTFCENGCKVTLDGADCA